MLPKASGTPCAFATPLLLARLLLTAAQCPAPLNQQAFSYSRRGLAGRERGRRQLTEERAAPRGGRQQRTALLSNKQRGRSPRTLVEHDLPAGITISVQ